MQLLKLILLLLYCTLAALDSAHSAPTRACAEGHYQRADIELCVPCPSRGRNPETYLKAFAQRHPECPYGTPSPDAGPKGSPATKATPLPRSKTERSPRTPTRAANPNSNHGAGHADATPKTTTGSSFPSRKVSELRSWMLPLFVILAVAAVIVGICYIRRIRKALVSCLKRACDIGTGQGDMSQPRWNGHVDNQDDGSEALNGPIGYADNQDDGSEAPNDQNRQSHNQDDGSEAPNDQNRQSHNQNNQSQSNLTSSSERQVVITDIPESPMLEGNH